MFYCLADQYRQFTKDLIVNLQALAIVLERRGYKASCYTCGDDLRSASFVMSVAPRHLVRFLVSECGISWTEIKDEQELLKLEGAEAIQQVQELAEHLKKDLFHKTPHELYTVASKP
jgi:Domain of unknown function (DUF1815)